MSNQVLNLPTFKTVIKNTPLVSIDLCLVCDGQILLGKRNNEPLKGWWFTPGGKIIKMKLGKRRCTELRSGCWGYLQVIVPIPSKWNLGSFLSQQLAR